MLPLASNTAHSVNAEKKQLELSFRSGDLTRDSHSQLGLSDLSEGQKIDGRVKKVEDYGLFIEIEGSKLSGLCHKSEVSLIDYLSYHR